MLDPDHKLALEPGRQLDEYCLLRVLGTGGFGVTYLAEHIQAGNRVAIKEYLPNELAVREGVTVHPKSSADRDGFEWGLARFLEEARTLARFEHRNVVRVQRYFEANNTAYLVMDYEDGASLGALLKAHGTLSEAQLRRVLLPIVDGLRAVHAAGFLHRDIKPDNVYVRHSDESPVLLDFGAARQALGHRSRSLTGVITAGYSPAEQYESDGNQGPWTDIYALSALCYKAINGQTPVDVLERQRDVFRHRRADPLPRLADNPPEGYSRTFLEAVDWGLRLSEADRPQTLDEWVERLEATGSTGGRKRKPPAEPKPRRRAGGTRGWVWAVAATLGVAAVGVATRWLVMNPEGDTVSAEQLADSSPSDTSGVLGSGSAIVVVATDPPGAQVFIGGEAAGQTLLQLRDVRAGMHDVVLDHPDFERVELGGETFVDDVVLRIERTLVPATGQLTVITEPETAWVERNGTRLAQGTPVTLEGLSAGTVELTLGAEAYRAVSVEAEVPRDGVGRLEWTLEPIPYGTLTVDVEPVDAIVTLPDIGPAYEPGMALLEGEHRVTVSREGYHANTRTVSVSGETRERVVLELSPQPFTVVTAPPDATIGFVDMAEVYEPGKRLAPGGYRVRVSAEGYEPWEGVVAHGREPTQLSVELERALVPGDTFADTTASGGEGPEMVVIPAGRFRMGCVSGQDCYDNGLPVHEVMIGRDFAMARYEVSVGEFRRFVEATGYRTDAERDADRGCRTREFLDRDTWDWTPERHWLNLEYEVEDGQPVTCMSWNDAQAYVEWLSRETGEAYRLPSESEWEYAARSGTTTRYHFGNDAARLCEYGNVADRTELPDGGSWNDAAPCNDGAVYPTSVGRYRENDFGLHDMHGNVWEWLEDCWNESYGGAPSDGSGWLSGDCERRVLRGGSWLTFPGFLRSASRFRDTTGGRSNVIGFRVARTLTP